VPQPSRIHERRPGLGAVSVSFAAILFGLNASTVKVILHYSITPEQLVLLRSVFTSALAGLILLFTNRSAFRVTPHEWPKLIAYGVVGVALMQFSYSNAVSNLPIGIALLIEYTAILMVPLVSRLLFKERFHSRLWWGIALVLGGLAVVSQVWLGGLNPVGLAWAIAAAIFLTVYFLIGEHTQRNRDAMSSLFYAFAISAVFWAVVNIVHPGPTPNFFETINLEGNLAGMNLPLWLALLWLGIMGSFLPMWLDFIALGNLSATAVGIIATAETVFATVFAWAWLQENVTALQVMGGLVVIGGIVLAETARGSSALTHGVGEKPQSN
jgi:drug/metabolite transporter (DMT)-like permease